MNLLHIDSSILGEQSVTRSLSAATVARLRELVPDTRVVYRDLAAHPVPQFSAAVLAAAAEQSLPPQAQHEAALLAEVLEEVLAADVIVVGAPMYNFGVPSQLKSWLDALAVPGRTFRYGADGVEGLLGDKRFIIASSRGNIYGEDSPVAALEHQESHLHSFLCGFLGVTRFEIVRAEGVRISPERADLAVRQAMYQVAQLQAA